MAKFDLFIPILLTNEARLLEKYLAMPLPKMFEMAKKSGWSDDKDDPGGATMCGITLSTFKAFRHANVTKEDLKKISFEEWHAITKKTFWDRWKADEIRDQNIANFCVDWTFNSGNWGIVIPQRVIGVLPDGIVGEKTIFAVNSKRPGELLVKLKDERCNFYYEIVRKKPSQKKFLDGWINRVNNFKA